MSQMGKQALSSEGPRPSSLSHARRRGFELRSPRLTLPRCISRCGCTAGCVSGRVWEVVIRGSHGVSPSQPPLWEPELSAWGPTLAVPGEQGAHRLLALPHMCSDHHGL